MTSDRCQRVDQLYRAALALDPDQRAAFLAEVCGSDYELRREVESLLKANKQVRCPAPVLEIAAGLRAQQENTPLIGRSLGHYRVMSLIGVGGMGEVYLAMDTKLRREVALKVIPSAGVGDPELMARHRREARILASLAHKNIAAIHGLEESVEANFLVLELIKGETLADRLARAGPMPGTEAYPIALQIAEALEYAHQNGVTHRDIKPANIKLTPKGEVKVLDFGLAKVFRGEKAGVDLSELTTQIVASTSEGQIVGTPPYMSPEQVRGEGVGTQTDIWAFGCTLYELLTARRAFEGKTPSDTLAAVLDREPDWRTLPPTTPENIRRLLRRCLHKDPAHRLHDISDARIEIEDGDAEPAAEGPTTGGPAEGLPKARRLALAGLTVLAVIAVTLGLWRWWFAPQVTDPARSLRMSVTLPEGVTVTRGPGFRSSSLALSPDGSTLVIAGTRGDSLQLYERPLNRIEAIPLAGAEGGSSPFFSPDGAWIGFFADGRLKRVPAGGGIAVDIALLPGYPAAGYPDGASWGPDNRIVFGSGARSPLYTVSARGGEVEAVTTIEAGELDHSRPEILSDGQTLLFDSDGWVCALDLASGRRAKLVRGLAPRYAATGHLILIRGTALLAAPFDSSRLELTGPVVPLIEGVAVAGADMHYSVSANGTLVYLAAAGEHELVMVESDGSEQIVMAERRWFENPQFSPDGRQVAVASARRSGEPVDLWIYDVETGSASRFTFDGGRAPVWTPDGAGVTFSHLGERQGIYTKAVDGRGGAQPVLEVDEFHWLIGWTPDARTLVFGVMEDIAGDRLSRSSIVAFSGGEKHRLVGPGNVWGGRLSPDGRWLAYYSLESGRFEVAVTAFPSGGTRWLISQDDGRDPSWAPDGTEVYYRSGDRLMAARIDTAAGIRVVSRRTVVEPFSPPLYDDYDIHPDGRALVLVRPTGQPRRGDVTVILNWFEELGRKVPSGR
jgi:eukaryotic-like serine/threonine-protein kinase